MKNRTEEYWELVGELSQPPAELAGSMERARKRARRTAPLRRLAGPAASLAGLAAAFVLLVNCFPTFALACSGVPVVRELAAAVAFSPSLSAAVAHDYVQYIGQSQTIDGVTVKLEYAIVDPVQAVFFYSVDGGRFYTSPRITALNGESIGGYGTSSSYVEGASGLDTMTLSFTGGEGGLPDHFTLEMFFMPEPEPQPGQAEEAWEAPAAIPDDNSPDLWGDPREDPGVLSFTFDVALSPDRISEPTTVDVDRWIELDGQRILVDKLELYPTRTIVYLGEDKANTAWLRSLKFYFTDEKGSVYDNLDGTLSASGEEDSESFLTYYFQSFYYGQPENLTLHITKAEWLEKDRNHVVLDLNSGDCPGLPDGVTVHEITRNGANVTVEFHGPLERQAFGQTFGYTYWDPKGGEHTFNQWSEGKIFDEDTGEETGTFERIYLWDYPWDTAELELSYTSLSVYEQPVQVPLA